MTRLEWVEARVREKAERRVQARIRKLAEQLRADLPPGIGAEAGPEGVRLIGRGLGRRLVLEPALRWLRLR